jgi:hypothetical protein
MPFGHGTGKPVSWAAAGALGRSQPIAGFDLFLFIFELI